MAAAAEDLGIANPMACQNHQGDLNMGAGEAIADRKVMEAAVTDMTAIGGISSRLSTWRRKSEAVKIRGRVSHRPQGPLRKERMYDFLSAYETSRFAD